jgi:hypothetical protein
MRISNLIESVSNRMRGGMYLDPVRDWLVLLILAIFAFISIVVWNVWAFETVAQGKAIGTNTATSSPSVNRSSIDSIHTIFEKRATEEAKYMTGVYRYADPSQ